MSDLLFPAHINSGEIQSVKDHCLKTAEYAREALKTVGLSNTGFLAGLLHDMGKCKEEFRAYISNAVSGKKVVKGSVNHTFAGVKFLLQKSKNDYSYRSLTIELLAFAVGSHHGQFDIINDSGSNGFEHRINDESINYTESVDNYLLYCFDMNTIDSYLEKAIEEISIFAESISGFLYDNVEAEYDEDSKAKEVYFMISLLSRMILSAVIEGDRRDTEEFMTHCIMPTFRNKEQLWHDALENVEIQLKLMPRETDIQIVRQSISNNCCEAAKWKSGMYRLNIPTGSGKTLSSLRYALAHAEIYNKDHIIFISPLLSILDQNAKVIRDFVNNDSIILEHHSNVIKDEDLYDNNLLEESWQAPIVITTLVQFLNTLFAGKTSSIRRFHSLCNSVIVIDEVQTVPSKLLSLFNMAVTFLSQFCGATVVLCSATQPCLEKVSHGLQGKIGNIIPYNKKYWECFKRTKLKYFSSARISDIPLMATELLRLHNSLLIICNKKTQAEFLYKILSKEYADCYHLSAGMCMQHRKKTLDEIYHALENSNDGARKVLCIATQVIEAGVDISFSSVIRLSAGMDNAVQAAGRCNRNGESKSPLPVYIVNCQDEQLNYLKEIQDAKMATADLCERFEQVPDLFQNELTSDSAIEYYYQSLYGRQNQNYQDFCVNGGNLFDLLSDNEQFQKDSYESPYLLRQAFKTAGDLFKVFDNDSYDILVPYENGKYLIEELNGERAKYDLLYRKQILQNLKPYTVSIFSWQKKKLEQQGGLFTVCNDLAYVLNENYYDSKLGILLEANFLGYMEV